LSKHLEGIGISLFDADSRGGAGSLRIAVSRGTTALSAGNSGVAATGSGTNSILLSGTMAQLNALMQGQTTGTVIHTSSTTGAVTYTLTATDEDSLSSVITFDGTVSTFAAPVITMPSAALTASLNTEFTLEALTGWNLTDADDSGEYATMTLATNSGTLTAVTGTCGATVEDGTFSGTAYANSSAAVRLRGTISSLKDFLQSPGNSTLRWTPAATGSKNVVVIVTDSDGQVSNTGSKAITVNSPPVVTSPSTFIASLTASDPHIDNAGFSIADSSANVSSMSMTISTDTGRLTLVVGTTGVVIDSGNPSGGDAAAATVVMHGTLAQLNLLLGAGSGASSILFHKTTGGTSTVSISVTNNNTSLSDSTGNTVSVIMSATTTWTIYASATPKATTSTISNFVGMMDLSKLPDAWWTAASADGRDLRVCNMQINADPTLALVPRHLLNYSKTLKRGQVFFKFSNSTSPPEIRVYAGATSATAPAVGATYGQYNVYDTTIIRGWYPSGGDSDSTSYLNNFTGFNGVSFGDTTADFGLATDYSGGVKYGTANASVSSLPETFASFVNLSDRSHITALGSTRGGVNNLCAVNSSKVTAYTKTSNTTTGAETASVSAHAVGDVTKGAWQFIATTFTSIASRAAYRDGGNVGSDVNSVAAVAGTNFYMIGATVKNAGAATVQERFCDGSIGLSFILAGLSDTLVPVWLANYKDAFNQAAYWTPWAVTTVSQIGL
jgi:hypothetical protein